MAGLGRGMAAVGLGIPGIQFQQRVNKKDVCVYVVVAGGCGAGGWRRGHTENQIIDWPRTLEIPKPDLVEIKMA